MKRLCLVLFLLALSLTAVSAGEPAIRLSAEEASWLSSHPVVRHAPDPDYAPLESRSADGQIEGIAPDILALMAQRIGVEVKRVATSSWAESQQLVRTGEADFLTVAARTPERETYLAFTQPYIGLADLILVRQSR